MSAAVKDAIGRVIAALTYEYAESGDAATGQTMAEGAQIPLLDRSIARDLREVERLLGSKAKGNTMFSANAEAIDEALLAALEAETAIGKAPDPNAFQCLAGWMILSQSRIVKTCWGMPIVANAGFAEDGQLRSLSATYRDGCRIEIEFRQDGMMTEELIR